MPLATRLTIQLTALHLPIPVRVCRDIENLNLEYGKLSLPKVGECDKEHRNVLADIRTVCEQLNLDVRKFAHIYLDSMNLALLQNTPTMSSREIAELCDKRHDNVMADIRKMLDELDIYAPDFSGAFITEQGNQYECLILVSGYNVKIRTEIIDRWQQLNLDVSKFGGIYLDSMNRQQTEYGKP